jgi:uncharacterized protein YndB with AHSA1/START domain
MSTIDWSRFVTRINIGAPAEAIYKMWATRGGMESWFVRLSEYKDKDGVEKRAEEEVTVGDTYKFHWFGYDDNAVEHGKILDLNQNALFKFSFGKAGNVTVTIKEEDGEQIVELIQDEIPTDEMGMYNYHVGCKAGWTFYLANLKSILEGGIDMRNKKIRQKEMLNS